MVCGKLDEPGQLTPVGPVLLSLSGHPWSLEEKQGVRVSPQGTGTGGSCQFSSRPHSPLELRAGL